MILKLREWLDPRTAADRAAFEKRVDRRIQDATGPWQTRQIGPLQVRYRRRSRREFVALGVAVDDLITAVLASPPGSWIVRFLWWLNGKLGGPNGPGA